MTLWRTPQETVRREPHWDLDGTRSADCSWRKSACQVLRLSTDGSAVNSFVFITIWGAKAVGMRATEATRGVPLTTSPGPPWSARGARGQVTVTSDPGDLRRLDPDLRRLRV